jgi:hypothetical protein
MAQSGECGGHIDVRTVHQVERILVIDGRNSGRLSINDDGAEGNERDANEREGSEPFGGPTWRLVGFFGVRRRLGKPSGSFFVELTASLLLHGEKTDSRIRSAAKQALL